MGGAHREEQLSRTRSMRGAASTWDQLVLQLVDEKSEEITLQELYKAIVTHPLVTPYHQEPWKPGRQPRYQCWARRCLSNLVRRGVVRRVGKGIYASR